MVKPELEEVNNLQYDKEFITYLYNELCSIKLEHNSSLSNKMYEEIKFIKECLKDFASLYNSLLTAPLTDENYILLMARKNSDCQVIIRKIQQNKQIKDEHLLDLLDIIYLALSTRPHTFKVGNIYFNGTGMRDDFARGVFFSFKNTFANVIGLSGVGIKSHHNEFDELMPGTFDPKRLTKPSKNSFFTSPQLAPVLKFAGSKLAYGEADNINYVLNHLKKLKRLRT